MITNTYIRQNNDIRGYIYWSSSLIDEIIEYLILPIRYISSKKMFINERYSPSYSILYDKYISSKYQFDIDHFKSSKEYGELLKYISSNIDIYNTYIKSKPSIDDKYVHSLLKNYVDMYLSSVTENRDTFASSKETYTKKDRYTTSK